MCITEKSVVVEREVAGTFITELRQNGAYYTDNEEEILKLATVCLNQDLKMNRGMEGKSAEAVSYTHLDEDGLVHRSERETGCYRPDSAERMGTWQCI